MDTHNIKFAEELTINTKCYPYTIEPRHEKTNILVSHLVLHKPGCTVTEDG